MESLRKSRQSGPDTFEADVDAQLDVGKYIQPISKEFIGNFFGYRRSANTDEIIRFNIEIRRARSADKVHFYNEFMRGKALWRTKGAGYCLKNTLYMFGHAVSANGVTDNNVLPESHGLRFFTLRALDETQCLHGLVMSQAGDIPIAARTILIRQEHHEFSNEIRELKRSDPKAWTRHMIEERPEYNKNLESQIARALAEKRKDYFLELIRNSNSSVLSSKPNEDPSIATKEQIIRNFAEIMGVSLANTIRFGYGKLLDDTISRLERAPSG